MQLIKIKIFIILSIGLLILSSFLSGSQESKEIQDNFNKFMNCDNVLFNENWIEESKIIALDGEIDDSLSKVSMDNDYAIIGATNDDNLGEKEHWALLICGGAESGEFGAGPDQFRFSISHAYESLINIGYDDDHIMYIGDFQDNSKELDFFVNKSKVKDSIEIWMNSKSDQNDDCLIVFFGHGGNSPNRQGHISVYEFNKNRQDIFPNEIDNWLHSVNYDTCTILIEACNSGHFINELSNEKRIVITSSHKMCLSTNMPYGGVFSYHFFNELNNNNKSYGESWEYAEEMILFFKTPNTYPLWDLDHYLIYPFMFIQTPQIDDNGDGLSTGNFLIADSLPLNGDGNLALMTYP